MRRMLLLAAFFLSLAWAASAQGGLLSAEVFDGRVVPPKQLKETYIRGGQLDPYHLDLYRSVFLTGDDAVLAEVSRRVLADAGEAVDKDVHRQGGLLVYAVLGFPDEGHGRRYLCYQCTSQDGRHAITLVYLRGSATLDELKQLFSNQRK